MSITRAEQALRSMVNVESAHHFRFRGAVDAEGFASPAGLVNVHGDLWTWRPLRRRFSRASKWGAPRACFANALIACATNVDLRYVEGFAYCGQFAVHHAWAVDMDDIVLDFTWREDVFLPRFGRAYTGVPCPIVPAFEATWNDKGYLQTDEALSDYTWDDGLPTDEDRRIVMERAESLLKGPRQHA